MEPKIFLVAHTAEAGEVHEILSAWTTRDAAEHEAERLSREVVSGYDSKYAVEEVTLDVPWND